MKKRSAAKEYKEAIVHYLLEKDGTDCGWCKHPLGEDIVIDHIDPLSKGGQNRLSNFQLLHGGCNCSKHDTSDRDMKGRMHRLGVEYYEGQMKPL
jgi:5-methylcytosine-specific restriction endonuclease McrA